MTNSAETRYVTSVRMALPFYVRLPVGLLRIWEPQFGVAALLNFRLLGEVSFRRACSLAKPEHVLDAYQMPSDPGVVARKIKMTCVLSDGREIPTLMIDSSPANGGFDQMRPFSEIVVFMISNEAQSPIDETVGRAFEALNRFLDVYRAVTQDPYVKRLDSELDVFLMEVTTSLELPVALMKETPSEILRHIHEIPFSQDERAFQHKYRLNTLEDLFPGPILSESERQPIADLALDYELPLHYDLIFQAQTELKQRHYHSAVIEAETAFEVYVSDLLLRVGVILGENRAALIADMSDFKKLQLLQRRLLVLDKFIDRASGHPKPTPFLGSPEHGKWKADLYSLRNRIVHAGLRSLTFDEAKAGIAACKEAIHAIEARVPAFANRLQIATTVDHLQNTAGRLQF